MKSPAADMGAPGAGWDRWHVLVSIVMALLGLFVTFSTSGTAIALGLLLVLAVARPRYVLQAAPWREPVMAIGLVLFAYIALHTLWTSGFTRASGSVINRYQELLLAPLVFAMMREARHRRVFIAGFLIAVVLLALAYWSVSLALPQFAPLMGAKRISSGFAIALAAFLLLERARVLARPWTARLLAAFLAVTVLFAMDGRTGQVILVVLAAYAAWVQSPPRWRLAAAIASPLVVVAIALTSQGVQNRFDEFSAASHRTTLPDAGDSSGIRLQLLTTSQDLVRKYWLAGAGFANHADVHEQAVRERLGKVPGNEDYLSTAWWVRVPNPHDEYLMQLIGGGIVSLALFLAWLAMGFRTAARAAPHERAQLSGTTLAFAVGCIFNCLLLNFVEGHIYIVLLGWLVAGIRYGRPPLAALQPDRVLVVATRQIGDVLLTTPLIHAAQERWPSARIDVVGMAGTLGMLRGNPEVNALIETPQRHGWATLSAARRLWRKYDVALVTDVGDRAHLIGWLAAPHRSGLVPEHSGSNWWKRSLLDHVVVAAGDRGDRHAVVEKHMLLAPWTGGAPSGLQVRAPGPAALPAEIESQLAGAFVIVHAPSMWAYKQWPIAHFEELVRGLIANGRQVVLTGSASARDQECIAPLRRIGPPSQVLDVSGRLDFNQLVTLFRRTALYIGPDTSVSHLAAATGVPVIAIFGPTNPQRWAPWPTTRQTQQFFARQAAVQHAGNVTLLQSSLHCVPCGRAGCENHRQSRSDCLPDIKPERVLEEALRLLS
jgi:ADP-heptose:LPS heptosyltransferase/O-antigen ligase